MSGLAALAWRKFHLHLVRLLETSHFRVLTSSVLRPNCKVLFLKKSFEKEKNVKEPKLSQNYWSSTEHKSLKSSKQNDLAWRYLLETAQVMIDPAICWQIDK